MKFTIYIILFIFSVQLKSQVVNSDSTPHCKDTCCEHDEPFSIEPELIEFSNAKSINHIVKVEGAALKSTSTATLKAESTSNLHPHIPNSFTPSTSKLVGEIPITGNVTPTGAQSYSIPISVEPGANGVQPNVSVVYNSQGGDGVLGKGWSIGGLSAVVRAGKSMYYDGKTLGVANNTLDAFILDGTRLICLSSNSSTITYESEQGNIKVVAYISGSNVKYFRIYYPNGSTAIMGYANNTTNKLAYPITHMTDKFGNVVSYSYSYLDNNYRINNIQYGRNGSSSHFAGVYFSYETRSDISFAWQNGIKIQNRYLLSSISCKTGSTTISNYSFNYKEQNGRLLEQLDCSVSGNSLNPLKFYYGEEAVSTNLEDKGDVKIGSFGNTSVIMRKGKFDGWSDNDGLIIYPNKNPSAYNSGDGKYYNMFHKDQEILLQIGLSGSIAPPLKVKAENNFQTIFAANIDDKLGDEVIKINHIVSGFKCKTQYKVYGKSGTTGVSYRKTVSLDERSLTNLVIPSQYFAGDFNGNGKMEVFYINANVKGQSSKCKVYDIDKGTKAFDSHVFTYAIDPKSPQNSDIVIPFDYDGDGKTDIIHINSTGTHVYTFVTSGSTITGMNKVGSYSGLKKNQLLSRHFQIGEFNGDGKPDFLLSPQYSYSTSSIQLIPVYAPLYCNHCGTKYPIDYSPDKPHFLCKRCNGYLSNASNCHSCYKALSYSSYYNALACPTHGDKVSTEIFTYINKGNKWDIFYSKGNGQFEKQSNIVRNTVVAESYEVLDANGDGVSDLVCRDSYGGLRVYLTKNGKLSSSSSGYIKIDKDSKLVPTEISSGNYYSTLITINDGTAKKIVFSGNQTVQSRLTGVVNSYGIVNKTRYSQMNSDEYSLYSEGYGAVFPYQDFNSPMLLAAETQTWNNNTKVAHQTFSYNEALLHRQGLGFRGFKRINISDMISGAYTYSFYDPLRYGLLRQQDTREASVVNNYSVSISSNKIAKLRLTSSTSTDKLKGNKISKSYLYDTYGNPSQETISYGDGISTVSKMSYTNYTNYGGSGTYILGIPSNTEVVKTCNNNSFKLKTTYAYDNGFGRLISKSKYHNNLKVSSNSYKYDTYGNVISETIRAYNSSESFTTSSTYDSNGRFVTETMDAIGKTTIYTPDNRGFVTSKTDFKDNTTSYQYDVIGRITSIVYPSGQEESTSYSWDTTVDNMYYIQQTSNIVPQQRTYYDAFGRELKSGTVSLTGWIYTYKEYDNKGRLYRVSLPTFSSKIWTTTSYDTYNRPTKITEATGAVTNYTYEGNGVTVSKEGRTSTKTTNVRGDLVSASDPGGTIVYQLRGDGQPSSIIAPGGITTRFTYDNYGRKTSMTDPSAGTILYEYDTSGNLKKQTNGNGKIITRIYDKYNRLKSETTPEMSTTYSYNSDGLATGSSSNNGTSTAYSYNKLLQLTGFSETVDGHTYSETYGYNNGRVDTVTYNPLNYKVVSEYNSNKLLVRKKNGGTTLWTLNKHDALGNVTQQTYGNGVVVQNRFDAYGFPTEIKASKASANLQHFAYSFNTTTGNLNSRSDQVRNLVESFKYDNLDRLTHRTFLNNNFETLYHANGNIKNKPGIGGYQYLNNKPYAVKGIENLSNVIPDNILNISYTSFERPKEIEENGNKETYKYNANYDRALSVSTTNGKTVTLRSYANGKYQHIINGSDIRMRLYLGGDAYSAFAVYEENRLGEISLDYLHRDYLGSITMVTDEEGNKEAEYSYSAWGSMRAPSNWEVYNVGEEPNLMFDRGYTGHEHLNLFGLINMNARLYDPSIGRFLSPDPYVQAPDFTQNFNRYSYALNNPLKFTDPNGEFFFAAVGIGVFLNAMCWGATIGAVAGGIRAEMQGGNFIDGAWRGAIVGAVGGLLAPIGGSGLTFAQNFGLGVVQGAATGALDASIWGTDIGQGMLWGGIAGGVFSTLTSENFKNMRKGKGFKNNSNVFNDFKAGKYTVSGRIWQDDALDFFGFEGQYSTLYDNDGWFNSQTGINYGDGAFSSFENLKATCYKESFEKSAYFNGTRIAPTNPTGVGAIDIWPQEYAGHKYLYNEQGLFPNARPLQGQILKTIEKELNNQNYWNPNFYNYDVFEKKWWHFVYRLPRRF